MSKPRVVIPVVVQFAVRYLLRTGLIQRMTAYAQPIILLQWEDHELRTEFEQAGAEVYQLPPSEYDPTYNRLKRQLDHCYLHRLNSPSTKIDRRRYAQLMPAPLRIRVRDQLYNTLAAIPGRMEYLLRLQAAALDTQTNIQVFEEQLKTLRADAIFSLTPYFQPEQLLLGAAHRMGLKMASAIISFDNITTRGWIPVTFDAYFLWNFYNRAELLRAYPAVAVESIVIVGAPQFDFYWDATYRWSDMEWRKSLGLPLDRPIILFGAGHSLIVPHEPHWLTQLDEAISSGGIPQQPLILFRRHPNDAPDRWQTALKNARHIIADDAWRVGEKIVSHTNVTRYDIEKLVSTLVHSHVHINASSTLTIDGAVFDRPQVGPTYDDRLGKPYDQLTRDLYNREHYLPITRSGGLTLADNRDMLIAAVRQGLEKPEQQQEARRQMVREIITYDDGQATARVSDAICKFLSGNTALALSD